MILRLSINIVLCTIKKRLPETFLFAHKTHVWLEKTAILGGGGGGIYSCIYLPIIRVFDTSK